MEETPVGEGAQAFGRYSWPLRSGLHHIYILTKVCRTKCRFMFHGWTSLGVG